MSTTRKALRSLVVVGVVGAIAGVGAFSAFTSQADNSGNTVTAGTVVLADNDANTALYSISNGKPGVTQTTCHRVAYTGSLAADVKIYSPSTVGALAPHVNLKIETGSSALGLRDCSDFVADASGSQLFNAALSTFPTSYAGGIADVPGSATSWVTNDAVWYRVTATLSASAPDSAQGATTGTHVLRWEAQNQ